MARAYDRWEAFYRRHQKTFERLDKVRGWWEEAEEISRIVRAETTTTHGAVVKDYPASCDQQTQTPEEWRAPQPKTACSVGVQTPPTWSSLAEMEILIETRTRQREQRRAREESPGPSRVHRSRSGTRRGTGCWNCGLQDHKYAECPSNRRGDFCYRCGAIGVTIKDCQKCREGWRAEGPYIRELRRPVNEQARGG